MIEVEELRKILINDKVLTSKLRLNRYRIKELIEYDEYIEYKSNFSSDEECFYNLTHDNIDRICPICNNIKKFVLLPHPHYTLTCGSVICKEYYSHTQEANDKKKKTLMNHYGVDNPAKSKEVLDKMKQTRLERYGDENYSLIGSESFRKNLKDKYGNEFYNNSDKISESKRNRTREEIDEEIKKSKQTRLERYNDENYVNVEKRYETMIDKYGKKSITNSNKSNKTKLERYGSITVNHKYNFDNINFDSSWELYFYIYNKYILNNNITRGPILNFEFEGKTCCYECDFDIDGTLYEVKGNQYLDENGELIFPYTKNLEFNQKKWFAKSQCMKDNNVKIVTKDEIENIMKFVDNKFTSDYVNLFKKDLPFPYLNQDLKDKSDMGLIHHFHKSIYDASRKGKLSPVKAWEDKNIIKKVALNRLKYVGSCRPSDILQGFNVTRIANKISVFKPKLAEDLLTKYCTTDSIFDPFSGFSGRMIGSANLGKSYYGQDINSDHVRESNEIIYYKYYKNCYVTVQDILTDGNKYYPHSTLFTCSPYGGKEHWNENNDEIEKSCDEWIDVCLEKYQCKEYIFVVDKTEKYKDYIVEEIENKSHFGTNKEYVLYLNSEKL